jgi:hypothetical protein
VGSKSALRRKTDTFLLRISKEFGCFVDTPGDLLWILEFSEFGTAVVLGLVVGIIISAACGYFDNSAINAAPVATFIWVETFPSSVSRDR